MGRWILGIIIGGLAVALFASGSVRVASDAPVPPTLAPWVEPAREAARREAGLVGLLPARFVGARCAIDGRTAVMAFESVILSAPSFATIGFPAAEDWNAPGATVAIIGIDSPDLEAASVEACAGIVTGPPE